MLVLENNRFKSVKACRPKTRQKMVNVNSSANSLKITLIFCTFSYESYNLSKYNSIDLYSYNV
ncbi:MAG: hypothetical protein LBP59_02625 [Planctomycetaceae bacterium]|nr:hypothetical protein [Planctomycetaceae bacterium]